MKTTRFLRRRCWMYCILTIGSLSLAIVLGEAAGGQKAKAPAGGRAAKRDAKEAAKMVEAIANRNKPPKVVKRRRSAPNYFPLFPKDYDWKEEERVYKALANSTARL